MSDAILVKSGEEFASSICMPYHLWFTFEPGRTKRRTVDVYVIFAVFTISI